MNKIKAVSAYRGAKKRLLLLDCDGVLASIVSLPELAAPSAHVLDVLTRLAGDPSTTCVVISGRPHGTLDEWLGGLPLDFAAEHGLWRKVRDEEWEMTADVSKVWKSTIRACMTVYERQLPGSFIEEKHASVGLHYRNVDLGLLGGLPALKDELQQLAGRFNLRILDGKKSDRGASGGDRQRNGGATLAQKRRMGLCFGGWG